VFEDPEFIAWANENVVLLVGHAKAGHKTIDVAKPAKGEPKQQCALYPGITCDDHDTVMKEAAVTAAGSADKDKDKPAAKPKKGEAKPVLPKMELKGFPSSFMLTPDGIFEKHEADRATGSCRDKLIEYQKKFDEHPIPYSKWADVKKGLDEADAALKAGKLKPGFDALVKVDKDLAGQFPKAMDESWKTRLEALDKKVAAKVAEAKKAKDPAAAKKAVQALHDDFGAALTAGPLPSVADMDAFLGVAAPAPAGGTDPAPAK
jgi:hypothetical protein